MLDFDDAVKKILQHTHRMLPMKISIKESLGCVLAEEVKARTPVPSFDSSSVDGFAVRVGDLESATKLHPTILRLEETITAGATAVRSLKPSTTMKIMTGAVIPRNAEAVVMKEFTKVKEEKEIFFFSPSKKGENLRYSGEEFGKGEVVFPKGTVITPPVVGMCAALGYSMVAVYRKPRVGLIVTGNELKAASAKLRRGQIHDSNSLSISAALSSLSFPPAHVDIVKDEKQRISKVFGTALRTCDVVVSAGGVSVGDFDFVKDVLGDLRIKTVFWKVAMKPGKPNFFGTRGKKLVFGLPGNPVSALVSFETLVVPALLKMIGRRQRNSIYQASLESDLRKSPGRIEFIRAVASRSPGGALSVSPVRGQGSHMIGGLAKSNCLIIFPKEKTFFSKGETVSALMLRWSEI
jgi:molybdopterin molybdotransferase